MTVETGTTEGETAEDLTTVECAGQFVMVEAQLVMVISLVEYLVSYTTDSVMIGVAVTGQTVVVTEMTSVLTTVECAGQLVIVGAQLVMV